MTEWEEMLQEFAELFMLQFWRAGQEVWEDYREPRGGRLLQGNRNTFTPAEIHLTSEPVIASKIRCRCTFLPRFGRLQRLKQTVFPSIAGGWVQ